MSSARYMAELTQRQKETAMKDAAELLAVRFKWYWDALIDACALPKLRGEEALDAYRSRTPDIWAALEQGFSKEAIDQRAEWERKEQQQVRSMDRAVGDKRPAGLPTEPALPPLPPGPAAPAMPTMPTSPEGF